MITITCKCTKTTMTFAKLTEADFPNGWENDCCSAIAAKAPKAVAPIEQPVLAKVWDTPEEDAAWADLEAATAPAITFEMVEEAAAKAVEASGVEEAPKPERKKSGPKAKAKE